MTLSGSYDFTVTRDDIIKGAFRALGLVKAGSNPPSTDVTGAAETLNLMIKTWQAEGLGLWLNKELTVFLRDATQSYSLGAAGGYATTSYTQTALADDAAAGATTIVVDSATGITSAYYIAVELDSGDLQWTTVNGAPASTTVTLSAALTGAASEDNAVFCFQAKAQRPLQLLEARLRDSDGIERTINIISRDEYTRISEKDSEGEINQVYYDPQLTNGVLYVWPSPDDVSSVLRFTAKYPIQDFDASTDNADFPVEWAEALKYNLAVRMAPEYMDDVAEDRMKYLVRLADDTLMTAKRFDAELGTSVYFVPNMRE